ncbi:pyrroline-5-carboxylate reductase [Balneolaceae bacterium YR4-1]|uniref:Pyrroline-5-carboxylate reductase n=1 Tax=Halalkalibaculum roseum TaxID=2709311 RepID=A0A6M1SS79_9BACT|nr:pyrroline-5-carboxylate reductase [Halalkalibaculum roseum]NGP75690.1 pyrroline-5-carboxylate reductase [Halalkalibaculum roseum]
MSQANQKIAILGAGNIGTAIASGLALSDHFNAGNITLTRRKTELLEPFAEKGFNTHSDNGRAVNNADIILIAVEPRQIDALLKEIKNDLDENRHILISVVSGVDIQRIRNQVQKDVPIVRAMPNTAIAIRESMTCIASEEEQNKAVSATKKIFDTVGQTLLIHEELMTSATALGACGIAFFLRAIRAASQGGIEIGFHAHEALQIAAQTAKGAASLLSDMENHPEFEIDRVTTPRGCTISGLNQMEHQGFSSAMIKGILVSAEKAAKLYSIEKGEGSS